MKKLIILANPKKTSFCHFLCKEYATQCRDSGHETTILDLYERNEYQEFLTFYDELHENISPLTYTFQSLITNHEELVFIFPIWWGDCPAILKNFFDSTFTAGFAYSEDILGKPKGLLTGKTCRIFATCGGNAEFYKDLFSFLWKKNRIEFCGMTLLSCDIFGNILPGKTYDTKQYHTILKQRVF